MLKPKWPTRTTPRPEISDLLREHGVIAVILFFGFVTRLFLADANSYWLDELYSVVIYGIDNRSVFEAVAKLTKSIHPPLYQFILYFWMALFGNSEMATRSLSNIYVAGATLCLYILAFRLYGLRVAIATALIFSLMSVPIYYALETRSYAQTLFLSSLSSLVFFQFLRGSERLSWAVQFRDARLWLLLLANFALLMTHYYNVFFLGAQGVFLLAYLLLRNRGAALPSTVVNSIAITAAPLFLLLITWGPVMARSYAAKHKTYVVANVPKDPFSILFEMVAQPNFVYPALALGGISVLLLPRLVTAGRRIYRGDAQLPAYFDFYFLTTTFMPCVLTYLLFLIAGHERYSPRYFVFCTPPLAVILALSLEQAVRLIEGLTSRLGFAPACPYHRLALLTVMLAAVLVVLPGGYRAATHKKSDWRGTAEAIVDLAASEPDKRFIIFETTFGKYPTLNYYLSRFSRRLRVHGLIQRRQERLGTFKFDEHAKEIGKHDYLVLAFVHHSTKNFPKTLTYLAEHYTLHFSAVHNGWGFIVYKVR